MDERLEAELPPADAKWLLMAAWILLGMRIPKSKFKEFQEAMAMVDLRESSTYQLILEEGLAKGKAEGKAEGARTTLLQIGARRLGLPSAAVKKSLNAVDNLARLRRMSERLLDVATWQELLDTP